ncbi:hypothetical protein Nos7524_1203 [Nostoc sp. PCC 7524]|nr:hypothetical protein Nos7524_1203 [Nostoc sp. PCC 7524]
MLLANDNTYSLEPVQSIVYKSSNGTVIKSVCNHNLIPGLDASFCIVCRVYWVNEHEIAKYYARKKQGINH